MEKIVPAVNNKLIILAAQPKTKKLWNGTLK